MHYYKKNIGDYAKKAGRLTMLQHGAYTLLMDSCYDREQFPTREQAIDWAWATTKEEVEAVDFILNKFFELREDCYVQRRIEEELDVYRNNANKNKQIAIEREAKKREKRTSQKHEACTKRAQTVHEPAPNHKPITNNQEPLNIKDTTRENVVSTRGVPIQEIVKKWNQFASDHQLPQTVKTTAKIAGQIRQRWKDDLPAIENWDNYFDYISKSKFLVGKTTPGNGRNKPFRATLEWVTKESNFAKIAAEEYH